MPNPILIRRVAASPATGVGVPYPAPEGYRWQQVVFGGVPVVYLNQPVFALELIQ